MLTRHQKRNKCRCANKEVVGRPVRRAPADQLAPPELRPRRPLAEGVRFQPGTELFGANVRAGEVRAMLERFPSSPRDRGAWPTYAG
jgi:hypothetical protein